VVVTLKIEMQKFVVVNILCRCFAECALLNSSCGACIDNPSVSILSSHIGLRRHEFSYFFHFISCYHTDFRKGYSLTDGELSLIYTLSKVDK